MLLLDFCGQNTDAGGEHGVLEVLIVAMHGLCFSLLFVAGGQLHVGGGQRLHHRRVVLFFRRRLRRLQ